MKALRLVLATMLCSAQILTSAQSPTTVTVQTADPLRPTCTNGDVPCRDWLRFRQALAGPYQGLAVATHGGHATIIISEPSAPRTEFRALVDAAFGTSLIG